ncbi:hypothetical protein EK21DRAFT_84586 [Setomelanomma holmii]|uniref:Uncharacterized protein n=1 Tax=Setomelanomma holmii TaxID=210430 RepID=A0A9P4HJR7_9PLEO|nr:hypothetical protein EK21DRAFT_84586 [Setomelanomma holmii]
MPFQLEDEHGYVEMMQACAQYLQQNRVKTKFFEHPITYVPNDVIDDVATLETIAKIVHADRYLKRTKDDEELAACAEHIYQNGRKLFAVAVKSRMAAALIFVVDMLAADFTDTLSPSEMVDFSSAVPTQHQANFDEKFFPTMRKMLAPTFKIHEYDMTVTDMSTLPLVSVKSKATWTDGPEHYVTFHPAHIVGELPEYFALKMKVFTDLEAAKLFREKASTFGFHYDGKYFCVY